MSEFEKTLAINLVGGGALFTLLVVGLGWYLLRYLSRTLHMIHKYGQCNNQTLHERKERVFSEFLWFCWHQKIGQIRFRYPLAAFIIADIPLKTFVKSGFEIYGPERYLLAR